MQLEVAVHASTVGVAPGRHRERPRSKFQFGGCLFTILRAGWPLLQPVLGAGGCPLHPSSDLDCGAPVSATERLSSWLQCEESEQRSQTKADKTAGEHSPQPGPRWPGLPSQWGAHQALGIALWAVGRLPQQWAWEWGTWGRCWLVALQLALWSWEVWGWRAGRQDGSHLFPRIRELTSRLSPTPTSHPWNLS